MACAGVAQVGTDPDQTRLFPVEKASAEQAKALLKEAEGLILNHPEEALELARQALTMSERMGDDQWMAKAWHFIGVIFYVQEDIEESIEAEQRALWHTDQLPNSLVRDSLHTRQWLQLATSLETAFEYEEASNYFLQALEMAGQLGDTSMLGKVSINIGNAYFHQDRYEEAITYYKQGEVFLRGKDERPGTLLNNLGAAYHATGMPDTALVYHTRASHFYALGNDLRGSAMSNGNIANIYAERKEFDKAIEYYQKSNQLHYEIGNERGQVHATTSLAYTLFEMGQYEQSLRLLDSLLPVAKRTRHLMAIGKMYTSYASVYAALGDYEQAYAYQLLETSMQDSMYQLEALERMERQKSNAALGEQQERVSQLREMLDLKEGARRKNKYIAIALASALLLLFISAFFFMRYQRLRWQHQVVESRQQLLLSQMKPHFIFNVLNSIQNFVLKGDPQASYGYIGSFSRLVHHLLNASDQSYTDLESELKAARHYLELEAMRTDHHFEFRIEVDPDVDQQNAEVPAMMLQTLLENAIWHGVMPAERKGLIEITVAREATGALEIGVRDNGIGREQSALLREQNKPGHRSRGLPLVKERIAALNRQRHRNIRLELADILSDNKVAGTQATLTIP